MIYIRSYPVSGHMLRWLIESWELADVWTTFKMKGGQYSYSHRWGMSLVLARLDHFYCFKHLLNISKRCFIDPVVFSDHRLVSCHVFMKNIHVKSTYWHFNTALLNDKDFRIAFKLFWLSHPENRPVVANI